MKRRNLLIGVTGLATVASIGRAEFRRPAIIGWFFLSTTSENLQIKMLTDRMSKHGLLGGSDYRLEVKPFDGANERLPQFIQDLRALRPDVIIADGSRDVIAMSKEIDTIPIIAPTMGESVALTLVGSNFARPARNVTGLTVSVQGSVSTLLEIGCELRPWTSRCGFLVDAAIAPLQRQEGESAAAGVGLELLPQVAAKLGDLPPAIWVFAAENVGYVVAPASWMFLLTAPISLLCSRMRGYHPYLEIL